MIQIVTTILLAFTLISFGQITQALKKLVGMITKTFLKLINALGIKIERKEQGVKVSQEFKDTYKDIRKVKLSKKNIKQKSSIDWKYFALLLVGLILVGVNFASISGNAISNWVFTIISWTKLVKTPTDMNTMYTAVMFSVISFSFSKLLTRWRETKQQRIESKQAKIKMEALGYMSSKELLDNAKKKDEEKRKELEK